MIADNILIVGLVMNRTDNAITANSTSSVTIRGKIDSQGAIQINSDSDINILGSGRLVAVADVNLIAANDLFVQGSSELQDDLKIVSVPVIKTEQITIEIVTGYMTKSDGVIVVPVINWIETTVTEMVGYEDVKVGFVYHTMDVTLTQAGYYNPRVAEVNRIRKIFIEGIDYYNNTDYPGIALPIPVINWAAFDITDIPSSDYDDTVNRKSFAQLTDIQKGAVLSTLGYMPLYDFFYENAQEHEVLEGEATTTEWVPEWSTSETDAIYYIDVSGWDDKYIRMPQGAEQDVLRVTSQGAAAWEETVGQYRDGANLSYIQDKSTFEATSVTKQYATKKSSVGVASQYLIDLGLMKRSEEGLVISNPIYEEVIPRELTYTAHDNFMPLFQGLWYVTENGMINTKKLLSAFQEFFRENSESWIQQFDYLEAGPQLLLQAFLQRIVNGGGRIDREYGLGRKRTDLLITWRHEKGVQKIVIELKIRYGTLEKTIKEGLEQTSLYMDKCGSKHGNLIIFDRDENKKWDDKIFHRKENYQGGFINIWGM